MKWAVAGPRCQALGSVGGPLLRKLYTKEKGGRAMMISAQARAPSAALASAQQKNIGMNRDYPFSGNGGKDSMVSLGSGNSIRHVPEGDQPRIGVGAGAGAGAAAADDACGETKTNIRESRNVEISIRVCQCAVEKGHKGRL